MGPGKRRCRVELNLRRSPHSAIGNWQLAMNKGLHRYLLCLTGATFLLLMAGALVTSHDAGLATSDWPRSNGRWFPRMVGSLFWEPGHCRVATTVGLLTIGLNVYLFKCESRHWVRLLGLVALIGVIAQGLLGGLTVKLMLPLWVSAAHATLAQLFFCTVVSLTVFTSKGWSERHETQEEQGTVPLSYLCVAAAVTIFLQLILGATLRHSAPWDRQLPTELVLAHVGGAAAVALVLGAVTLSTLRRYPGVAYLTRPASLALTLLVLQLLLGVSAYITRLLSPFDPQPLN